jgi:hypothetical protein
MTISTTVSRVDCPGNGAATVFSFSPAIITQASDLMVWMLDNVGNQTLLTQGTGPAQYTVNVPAYPGTGSITYPGAGGTVLATGWKLTIKQRAPLLQTFQPQNQGAFLASTYGAAYDYETLNGQALQEQINRSIRGAETDATSINMVLPTATDRASQFVGFDSLGNLLVGLPPSAPVSAAMQPVVDATTLAAARTAMGVSSAVVSTAMAPVVDATTVAAALNLLTANAITQTLSGQFYQSSGAVVNRIADRLFVGQAVSNSGNLVLPVEQGTAGGWLDYYQALVGLEPTASAQFASYAGGSDGQGTVGVIGASQSLHFSALGQTSIGVIGYSYANNVTLANSGWSYYGESYRMNNTAGNAYGAELAVVNQSGVTSYLTPYTSQTGVTIGYQADSGSGWDVALQPGLTSASAAFTIVQNTSDNSAPWLRGMVALNNSIAVNGVGVHEAMSLPVAYGIQWYNSSGSPTSYIYGAATTGPSAALQFNTAGAAFVGGTTGVPIATLSPVSSAVNYINIQSAATSNPPSVSAAGSDTNVNLVLSPQGTASILTTGPCAPFTNNAYACGATGNKWTAVWAVNGTIQTSDPTMKTEMAPLPAALPIIAAISPITFKWKLGGPKPVAKEVEIDDPVYEEGDTATEEPQLQPDGTYRLTQVTHHWRRPIIDVFPVLNADGTPVMDIVRTKRANADGTHTVIETPTPRMHEVQRTQKKTVTQHDLVDSPGTRTHWGFSAADIKAATPEGMDWAAYVKGEDGTEHIRPDQLIPVLWKAMQEMAAKVEALTKEVTVLKAWVHVP